jgi:hypothetical protein
MKTEQQYVNDLIGKYLNVPCVSGNYLMSGYMSIQCAKIDVQNTIDALNELWFTHCDDNNNDALIKYYTKVLTILNDMK